MSKFTRRSAMSQKYGVTRLDADTGEVIRDYRSHAVVKEKPYVPVKVPQNQQDPRQNGR